MSKKQDPRVLRTQKRIKEAYLVLLANEDHENILIKQVTYEAKINRATFYRHFHDKDHLLQGMINENFEQLTNEVQACNSAFDFVKVKQPHPRFVQLLTSIKQRDSFFFIMLKKQKSLYFYRKFEALVHDSSLATLDIALAYKHEVKYSEHITRVFISTSILGIIRWWVEEKFPCEPAVLAQHITDMIDYGIYESK
ncbi:TetR/AcrR family transcriptional regulator [Halobacillus naozhouensis]|uniref:TetR/AcrR family transcriptional regulator n=1 Tax=Halobacillus naozhouensis TaxID=554880 RepID=A0ABY8IXZ7_9BACI|nr:TetR/AcrR family transcriptional regulator [Halobacillus naozhouensis]WFT75093.1 TetR/AcrR family transcriptional regulator [Halobacillus naozhouensis]